MRAALTQDHLKRLLDYDPATGAFTWKYRPWLAGTRASGWNRRYPGTSAGCTDDDGYIVIAITGPDGEKHTYFAHQLAWLYAHGVFIPQIDHKNRTKNDNRLDNLREATTAQNGWNVGLSSRNKSGVKGVNWHKASNAWIVRTSTPSGVRYWGTTDDLEMAAAIAYEANAKFHGEFASGGV